jgi:ribosome-associated protein
VAESLADLAITAAAAADAKQGQDTIVLEVGEVLAITDYFVITSAANTRAVRTISEAVEARVAEVGEVRPTNIEGLDDLRWILMDYSGFVVHVFLDETRRYYDLERLWADVPRLDWADHADQTARSG